MRFSKKKEIGIGSSVHTGLAECFFLSTTKKSSEQKELGLIWNPNVRKEKKAILDEQVIFLLKR